jgi:hypothetical protein
MELITLMMQQFNGVVVNLHLIGKKLHKFRFHKKLKNKLWKLLINYILWLYKQSTEL